MFKQHDCNINILYMNFIDVVEIELKTLDKLTEQLNKNAALKIKKLLEQLITIKDSNNNNHANRQTDIDQFIMVFQTKNHKLVTQGLSLLQKLLNVKVLSRKHYEQIVSQIITLKSIDEENIQMKIIQSTMSLITPALIDPENLEFIIKIYSICFQVASGKVVMIQKIAISALLQLTELLYSEERFIQYSQSQTNNCLALFKDFLNVVVDNKVLYWIPKGMGGIIWDLNLQIIKLQGPRLTGHEQIMAKLTKIMQLTSQKCFTKKIQNSKYDFVRFFRAYCYLLMYVQVGLQNATKFNIVNDLEKGFLLNVYVEGLMMIAAHEQLFPFYDQFGQLSIVFQVISHLSEELCISNQVIKSNDKKIKLYLDSPTVILQIVDESSEDWMIYRAILNGLALLRVRMQNQIGTAEKDSPRQSVLRKTLQKMAPYVVKSLRYLISIQSEEDLMRRNIQQFQQWFIISSRLKVAKPKNRFLEELVFLTTKIEKKTQAIKSAQALQVMFNLIYGYQEYLDSSNLSILLKCFQTVQQKYYKQKANNKQWELDVGYEIEPKITMINTLYDKNTIHLNQISLKNTVQALNEVTLVILEELSEEGINHSMRIKTFGVRKMKVVVENNAAKIVFVWNFIVAHFIYLCSCKYKEIRIHAIEILTETISTLLVSSAIPQDQLLSIYFQIVKTKFIDVKLLVVQKLIRFLTDHGFKIEQRSLVQIVKILKLTQQPPTSKRNQQLERLMEKENQLNELLMKECLVNIQDKDCLKQLIHNYRIISDSKNHQYSGVGLLWLVADHLKELWKKRQEKIYNKEFFDLEKQIFSKLYKLIIEDKYHEVRQSAIHALTQIIGANMEIYSQISLQEVIDGLYIRMFSEINLKYLKNADDPIQQKQWYETVKNIYSNLFKLVKRLNSEELLTQKSQTLIMQQICENLNTKIQLQLFYYQNLQIISLLKNEIKGILEVQKQIMEKIKERYEKIDKKERINRHKLIPLFQQLLSLRKQQ